MTRTVISIDWDFFLWRGLEAEDSTLTVHPGTDRELTGKGYGASLFDWGHSESWGGALQAALWASRYSAFLNCGLDPHKVAGVWVEKGCTPPDRFVDELEKRFDFDGGVPVEYSDSHALGAFSIVNAEEEPGEVFDLVLFDAHHDLGYPKDRGRDFDGSKWDCGSWVWAALHQKLVRNVTVVYPDWRGLTEWDSARDGELPVHLETFRGRVRATTWSDWLAEGDTPHSAVALVNVARSGSWTPPWKDREFESFVYSLPASEWTCLDCNHGQKIGPYDACEPREWDEEAMSAWAEAQDLAAKAAREGLRMGDVIKGVDTGG